MSYLFKSSDKWLLPNDAPVSEFKLISSKPEIQLTVPVVDKLILNCQLGDKIEFNYGGTARNFSIKEIKEEKFYFDIENGGLSFLYQKSNKWLLPNNAPISDFKLISSKLKTQLTVPTLEQLLIKKRYDPGNFIKEKLDTQAWIDEQLKNKDLTEPMKARVNTTPVRFCYRKDNKSKMITGFVPPEILPSVWSYLDFMQMLLNFPDIDFILQDRKDKNVYHTRGGCIRAKEESFRNGINKNIYEHDLYPSLDICKKKKKIHLHRLTQLLPEGTIIITGNHRNGCKQDYRWENLETSSVKANSLHAHYELQNTNTVSINVLNENGESKTFLSLAKTEEFYKIRPGKIGEKLRKHRYYSFGGNTFTYTDKNYQVEKKTIISNPDMSTFIRIFEIDQLTLDKQLRNTKFNKNIYFGCSRTRKVYKQISFSDFIEMKTVLRGKYLKVQLTNDNKKLRSYFLHRILMILFKRIVNYAHFIVDHHDNNPLNNDDSNLRWTSRRENVKAAQGLFPIIRDASGVIKGVFRSAEILGNLIGAGYHHIADECHNKTFRYNYWFSYCKDEEEYQRYKNVIEPLQFVKVSGIPVTCTVKDLEDHDLTYVSISDMCKKLGLGQTAITNYERSNSQRMSYRGSFTYIPCNYYTFQLGNNRILSSYSKIIPKGYKSVKSIEIILKDNKLVCSSIEEIVSEKKKYQEQFQNIFKD